MELLSKSNKKNIICGIGVVIFNQKNQLLTVLEKKDAEWKNSGQRSIVFGTKKENKSYEQTVLDEMKEETGITVEKEHIGYLGNIKAETKNNLLEIHVFDYKKKMNLVDYIGTMPEMKDEIDSSEFVDINYLLNQDIKYIRPVSFEVICMILNQKYIDFGKIGIKNGIYQKYPYETINNIKNLFVKNQEGLLQKYDEHYLPQKIRKIS